MVFSNTVVLVFMLWWPIFFNSTIVLPFSSHHRAHNNLGEVYRSYGTLTKAQEACYDKSSCVGINIYRSEYSIIEKDETFETLKMTNKGVSYMVKCSVCQQGKELTKRLFQDILITSASIEYIQVLIVNYNCQEVTRPSYWISAGPTVIWENYLTKNTRYFIKVQFNFLYPTSTTISNLLT